MDAESLRLALSGIGPEALWIGLLAG